MSQVSSDRLSASVVKSLSNLPDMQFNGLESMLLLPSTFPTPAISHPTKGDGTGTTDISNWEYVRHNDTNLSHIFPGCSDVEIVHHLKDHSSQL
jgi:hypothetical protein